MRLIKSKERPWEGAIHQDGDLWLVPASAELDLEDGAELLSGTAARDTVQPRDDLDPDHPLYGQRALRSVPAGHGDIVVSDLGELEPAIIISVEP